MKKGSSTMNFLMVALFTFALGFYMGGAGCGQAGDNAKTDSKTAVKKADTADKKVKKAPTKATEDRFAVPIEGSSWTGSENALITIVEISDFQCPYCSKVGPTLKKIMDTYKGQVRRVWFNNPLPFHKDAPLASEASLAAGEQGKFWEMHDKIFENQRALKRENLDKYAEGLGLDMGKFKAALDSGKFKKQIEKEMAIGKTFGARGTPHFFINGIRLKGAQPFAKFKAVIDAELPKALALQKSGEKNIYKAIIKNAKKKADPPKKQKPRQREEDKNIYKVTAGNNSNAKGNVDGALITIVEFSEFQCPFCSRVNPTIKKILEEYKGKVRVFFRHNPLPFHKDAPLASKAALAAGEQGKFWKMHDILFKNQKALKEDKLISYAKEIGLNVGKFTKDLKSTKFDAEIKADQDEAKRFGARGTPGFFVNGRKIVGAQPFANFKKLIDEILPVAEKAGKKGDALYAFLTKNGKTKAEAPKRKQQRPKEDPNKVFPVKVGSSYYKGGKNAQVTIIEFSEFQCPFCSRVNPTMDKIQKKYGNKVKIVFKHNPLPFHKDAPLASQATLAAGEQGKFWEMHDILFKNQRKLKRENLEEYAKTIGLNVDKFKKALDSGAFAAQIAEDQKYAKEVGARGTPAFLINGKKLVGAQPYENFEKMIEAALKAK